jgi:SAM-dependent methyltransferase
MTMLDINSLSSCPVCSGKAKIVQKDYPGYQEPTTYDIFHCDNCDTSFSNPLEINCDLYDLIYSKPDDIVGYERYSKYAQEVLRQKQPLEYLSKSEETYWSIKSYLERKNTSPNTRILEVGCGLGYLTYSLIKAGFNATGLDISINAVEQATARYGDHFVCEDLHEYSQKINFKYDTIILTEVIEHIPNIYELLNSLDGLLADGGDIVITTPNKSSYPQEILWNTDLPPIHLWWFSESSMNEISSKIGYSLRLTDFTECNSINVSRKINYVREGDKSKLSRKSTLDESGNPIKSPVHNLRQILDNIGVSHWARVFMAKLPLLKKKFIVGKRRPILCAIFSKK